AACGRISKAGGAGYGGVTHGVQRRRPAALADRGPLWRLSRYSDAEPGRRPAQKSVRRNSARNVFAEGRDRAERSSGAAAGGTCATLQRAARGGSGGGDRAGKRRSVRL